MGQESLASLLTDCGFEHLHGTLYRGNVSSPVDDDQNHAVILDLGDSPSLMTPVGDPQMDQEDLDASRQEDDGCEVVVIGDHTVGLVRHLSSEVQDLTALVDAAVAHGSYGAVVEFQIRARQERTKQVLDRLNFLIASENWNVVHSGEVSVEDFMVDAEYALTKFPNDGMWNALTDSALRASVWIHSQSGPGTRISEGPWYQIGDRLMAIGESRGWELSDS